MGTCSLSFGYIIVTNFMILCQKIKSITSRATFQFKDNLYSYRDSIYKDKINGLAQDCGNSSALAMELLQSCTKP